MNQRALDQISRANAKRYAKSEELCPACGYTQRDAQIHMDHQLCKNDGNAPWQQSPAVRNAMRRFNEALDVKTGVLTVKLSDVKTLSERDRHALRFYVRGGSTTEVRYRDEPEVRTILKPFLDRNPVELLDKDGAA